MINPLNELSSVYLQSIAEGCECEDKPKEKKVKVELPGTKRPDGGDGAAPNDGKNLLPTGNVPMGGSGAKRRVSKYAVEPLSTEEYKELPKRKMGMKAGKKTLSAIGHALKVGTDGVGSIESQKQTQQADKRANQADKIHSIAKKHNSTLSRMKSVKNKLTGMAKEDVDVKEGHCEEEGVECSSVEKKKDSKKMKKESKIYSSWRDDSEELLEVIGGYAGSSGSDNENNLENPKAKTDNKSNQRITEKSVKNKIKINPPQGVTEGFAELGGVVAEMYELVENTPQDNRQLQNQKALLLKKQQNLNRQKQLNDRQNQRSSVAQNLQNPTTSPMESTETEDEKKKREMLAKTKEHDDKQSGKLAEADMSGAPSIKDAKPAKKTNVKYDSRMKVMAPTIKKEGRALAGILSTIRSKNGMGTVTAKGADKLQDKKEKTMGEEMSVKDQMRISREAAKNRNPNPDHRKINAMKASNQKKDNRSDSQKMTDATGPRKGSNYRGD